MRVCRRLGFSVFFALVCQVSALKVTNLEGSWTVQDADKEHHLMGIVPGGIYTDLMRHNIIGDIFYGNNDIDTRWVAKKSWIYSRQFQVDQEFLNHDQINIVFDGLDTFSDIRLNAALIGTTENMFVSYSFDIKKHLKAGNNEISVTFLSPIQEAKALFDVQSKNYSVVPLCVPNEYHGECHVNHIRKMQASFSWDWGPAFPSVGIWKPVYLEAFNTTIVKDVVVQTKEVGDLWEFTVTTYLQKNSAKSLDGTLVVTLFSDEGRTQNVFQLKLVGEYEFVHKETITLPKSHFKLWWPNGMGEQNLYKMKITYVSTDNAEQSTKRFKIGLRTVELVQDKLDVGRSFYFKINGVPFFAKGSNIIPSNILPELGQNETKIRFLLQSSKDVHMNMIRVWGGGIYESEIFYQIADELGILIWQDFMFACSMYPTNDDFLNTVKVEVKQQVRRLQHHASVVLWAGNNENEAALRGNWYGTARNFTTFKNDYVKLYVDTVRKAVFENDDSAIFLTSSPTNGLESDLEGFVANNPYDPLYGDVHFYNYIFDSWNQNVNPITRFASEYGYQSMPSANSILTATNKTSDLNIGSDFLAKRQHHPMGYTEMRHLIGLRLRLPKRSSPNFDAAFIFYSQIHQAMSIKLETEFNRQWMSHTDSTGKGNTMGALYWQLNDVWIAPSWASIDFNNNWKMLHYYAKEFFSPIIVTFHLLPDKNVDVYVVSDLTSPIYNATVEITLYRWSDGFSWGEKMIRFDLKPGSKKIDSFSLNYLLSHNSFCGNASEVTKNCFLVGTVFQGNDRNATLAPDNILMPAPLKDCALGNAKVKVGSIVMVNEREFKISVATDKVAAFVWFESSLSGRFSQNGFFQIASEKEIVFHADEPTTEQRFTKSLSVTHLLDDKYL